MHNLSRGENKVFFDSNRSYDIDVIEIGWNYD
jgi:hypothetical protein